MRDRECDNGLCSGSPESSPLAMLAGPDGQRRFREWPLDAATLRGATLTAAEFPHLKWSFAADGTHALTNGGDSLPDGLKDLIEVADYRRARTASGTWSVAEPPATGIRELTVRFTHADGKIPHVGFGVIVFPYHSSPAYVHFCRDTLGQGGLAGPVRMFKITPAEGQPLPSK
jgi:hypothetical protein